MILKHPFRQLKSMALGYSAALWEGDSDDMMALHDRDGTFAKVSGSAATVAGYAPTDLVGLSLGNITAPDDRGEALGALARACSLGQKGRAEFRLLRGDGTVAWAEMTASVDSHGRVRTIVRDIDARKAKELAASESNHLIRADYLADLSHEIRTPLNAVIGFADAMRNETFGPVGHAKYEEYAGLIHKSGEHLLSLVSGLLDMSKIEADKYTLNRADTDIAALLDDCAGMMRGAVQNTGLWLRLDIEDDAPMVRLDPQAVRQIVLNLLSNAIKFTKAGGVTLRLRHDAQNLWISVMDTGVGMDEEQLAKVGKRFEQAGGQSIRGGTGTGLGLALSHALAGLHNGELRLDSQPGDGTKATIRLPMIAALNAVKSDRTVEPVSAIGDDTVTSVLDNLKRKTA